MRLCLIDLPILFRARWHASEHEEIGSAYVQTLAAVRGYAGSYDHTAVCVDRPPYLRQELSPAYKAHREKASGAMLEQYDRLQETLAADGMWVIGARGLEADDIIATLAQAHRGQHEIVIVSGDKDALALVGGSVTVLSPATGAVMDEAAVVAKLGVQPSQVADWLAIVGDTSDGIPGIKGAGPKTAAAWLQQYGDLKGIFYAAVQGTLEPERFRSAFTDETSGLVIHQSKHLATLRTDAPIDPQEIFKERPVIHQEPETKEAAPAEQHEDTEQLSEPTAEPTVEMVRPRDQQNAMTKADAPPPSSVAQTRPWEMSLEPGGMQQAWWVSQVLFKTKMFGDYRNPESILATIMTGRLYGLDAVTSLRSFHIIKGKQTMSAALMVGVIKRSPVCEFFRLIETTERHATWEAKRRGDPPIKLSFTLDEAKQAGLLKDGGNWSARPKTMLRWRAATELARAVFPDVVAGLYSSEEMQDVA